MSFTDRVHLWQHHRIRSQLEVNIPKRAFAGASMEILHSGEGFDNLDEATRDQLTDFVADILVCECEGAPFCGHPERRFIRYVLDLRAGGLDPDDIVRTMQADYHLEAYPGDVLTFLDDSVRRLEALESLADVEENQSYRRRARERREALEGP